jgi:hypothetical protein
MMLYADAPFGEMPEYGQRLDEQWVEDLRASISGPSGEFAVEELGRDTLENGVHWAIQLPSLKRIQVVDGPFGGRFLELRQYRRKDNGDVVRDRVKFIRLGKVCLNCFILLPPSLAVFFLTGNGFDNVRRTHGYCCSRQRYSSWKEYQSFLLPF